MKDTLITYERNEETHNEGSNPYPRTNEIKKEVLGSSVARVVRALSLVCRNDACEVARWWAPIAWGWLVSGFGVAHRPIGTCPEVSR